MHAARWTSTALVVLAATIAAVAGANAADDLIPRRVIFGNPERTAPFISPDGKTLVYTAAVDGVMNIWVAPVGDLSAAKPLTHDKQRPIVKFWWAQNGTHILYLQDQGGDENDHLFTVEVATGTARDLTPYKGARAEVVADSPDRPDELLVAINNRDPRWQDVWLINIVSGESKLVLKNDGFASFLADSTLTIRLGAKPTPDGGRDYLRLEDGEWKPFATVPGDDALTTEALFFGDDDETLYMIDSRGRDKSALTAIDIETGKSKIIATAAKSDVAYVIADPQTYEPLAYSAEYDRMEWTALDDDIKGDIEFLNKQVTGHWWVLSQSKDGNRWTIWIDDNGQPIRFGLYDRRKRALKALFAARPNLEGAPLPITHPRILKSRDGLDLVSYLTLPKGSDANGDGIPDKRLPLVLNVHGGPWARDSLAYSPPAAWLANRGYAVLSVNFRGSTGFGKTFVNAGDKQWGAKMQDDLIDAVDWAVKNKIAVPDKVAIYGSSYGGYATLVGLTQTPDKFACGINIVGPSNLKTMLANLPAYWTSMLDTYRRRVGDPGTTDGRALLTDRSPLFRAAKIQRPLLIAQGANDPRVKQSEADQIVRAMTKKNLPVTYVLYADEGHGFARPENRLSFYAISEAFLAQCLGGRAEPIGKDFEGSSVAVPTGKQHIRGLKEALSRP